LGTCSERHHRYDGANADDDAKHRQQCPEQVTAYRR
jgi:hypothetical protein